MTSSMITTLLLLLFLISVSVSVTSTTLTHELQPPTAQPNVPVTNPVEGTVCADKTGCPPATPISPPPPATCPPPTPISPPPFPWPETSPPPPPFPCPVPSPPPPMDRCPIDILKMGACIDLLGGMVHIGVGDPAIHKCCPMIAGLIEIEAAVCLCTTLRIKAMNLNLYMPLALHFLIHCGKTPPPGFNCFF